jgi:hypothetical protein
MHPAVFDAENLKTGLLRFPYYIRQMHQAATGKNRSLQEECLRIIRDIFRPHDAAVQKTIADFEQRVDTLKVFMKMRLAHMLKHPDGGSLVELCIKISVVPFHYAHLFVESSLMNEFLSVLELAMA